MNVRRHWPIVVPFAFALAAFHAWFLPGLLLGDDQFRFSSQQLASYFPWRNAWDPSFVFGISSGFSSPAYPLWAVVGALTRLGVDFAVIERLVWFWPLFVGLVVAPYAFVYRLAHAPWAASVAAAAFAINTWTISLVQRGHIPSLVAYAITPFVALAWLALLSKRRPVDAVTFAALLTMQVIYDLRYAYIAAIACLMIGAFEAARALARRRFAPAPAVLRAALWTIVALLAFNAYWLIPQFAAPAHLPAGYDTLVDFVNGSQSQSLASALALFYPFYHYVQGTDPFAPSAVEPAFFIVVALVVVACFSVRRRWVALSLAAAALAGIILTAGPNSPFGRFDEYAFAHVPGMTLFRDISKFSALVAFAYAALLGLGFARLAAALRSGIGRRVSRPLVAALACLSVAAYAWLLRDAFNPMRLSNFATTTLSPDDRAMQDFVDRQPGYFRTVLFPTWQPELVGTAAHPVVSADYLVNSAARDGGLGDFFPSYATLLERLKSPLLPKLLAEAAVRYVVVDDDPKGILYKPFAYDVTHAQSVAYFQARPWLREVARFGGFVVFELTSPSAPRSFFAQSPVSVNGSPQSLAALVGTPAWSGLPAAVIPAEPSADPTHRSFVTDPASGAETVTAEFSTSVGEPMHAWVGAIAPNIFSWPAVRVRMKRLDELTPSAIPDQPILPSPPVTVEIDDPGILSAPYADPPGGAQWRGIVGASADIGLTNWSDSALSADVTLPAVFAPDSREQIVRVTAGEVTQTFVVGGELFGYAPRKTIVVRGLVLVPGLNLVRLDVSMRGSGRELPVPANAYSLIFADDLTVGNQSGEASFMRHAPQPVAHRASFALFSALAIPLARAPKLSIAYELPPGTARLALYAELRRRDDGKRIEFVRALPVVLTSDTIDLVAAVQAAQPSVDASAFDLVAVRLAIVGSNQSDVSADLRTVAAATRIVDARIDVSQAQAERIPTVRYLDLRRATITAAGGRPTLASRLAQVRAPTGRAISATIAVPVIDDQNAAQLVFWTRSIPDEVPDIDLTFTSHADGRTIIVRADPHVEAPADIADPNPTTTMTLTSHVVNGDKRTWRRSVIDLAALKYDHLPAGGARYLLTGIEIAVGAQLESIDLSDLALVWAAKASPEPASLEASQSLVVDGRDVPIKAWRQDPLTLRYVGESAPFEVGPGRHRFSVEPPLPLQPVSMYTVSRDLPKNAGHVRRFTTLSPSEDVADVDDGGLLVWPMSFAPGWQAYRLTTSDAGVTPTGLALLDAWRFRADRVPEAYHDVINGAFNGWFVAPGAARVVLLYGPEAVSELAALLWLLLSAWVVLIAFAGPRRRP